MNISLENLLLRASAAVFLASALVGCAHQATTVSTNKQPVEPIKLSSVEFVFVPVEFKGVGYQPELHKVGYYSGALTNELGRVARAALLANGIEATLLTPAQASSITPLQYRLVVKPAQLNVITNEQHRISYSTMDLEISLVRRPGSEAVWIGKHVMSFKANDMRSREVGFGDLTLAVLNALQSSRVIALPVGYAITPKGNRSHVLDY